MSQDLILAKETAKTREIVANSTSFEEMMSALRAAAGMPDASVNPFTSRSGSPSGEPQPVVAAAAPTMPDVSRASCYRVVYPHGNTRVELLGASEEDLDQQEQRIRSLYA
jgi:hypothetical protein